MGTYKPGMGNRRAKIGRVTAGHVAKVMEDKCLLCNEKTMEHRKSSYCEQHFDEAMKQKILND